MRKRRWARWLIGSVVAFFAFTAFVHTKTGLRTIAWITGSDGCPFGGAKPPMTAQAAEELRVAKLDRGTELAPSRPAHGFKLDVDRRADIAAWIAKHDLSCVTDKSGAGVRCEAVNAALLPDPIQDLEVVVAFGFDTTDRLVSLQLQSMSATTKTRVLEAAATAMSSLERLGGSVSRGDELASATFVHRAAAVNYRNYVAKVIASNLGKRLMMSETYQSIPL